MKVNVYVNWNEQKVCSYEDFLDEIQKEVDNNFDEWLEDWLDEHYTKYDLFYLTDSEKEGMEEKIKAEMIQDTMNDRIGYEWEMRTIEI